MPRVAVEFTERALKDINAACGAAGLSRSAWIRTTILAYLDRKGKSKSQAQYSPYGTAEGQGMTPLPGYNYKP